MRYDSRSPFCYINFIPSIVQGEITYPFPNFRGATVEVWECVINFIPYFIMGVIAISCWD